MPYLRSFILLLSLSVSPTFAALNEADFVQMMHNKHSFNTAEVQSLLNKAVFKSRVIELMDSPGEGKPWFKYRKIFLTTKRIREGNAFMKKYAKTLRKAEKDYGVPAEMITAIIGVETYYGRITGGFRVLDVLKTLAFHYPRRADFFQSELEHFFLMLKEFNLDNPLKLKGSYAGAMGLGQFIASSYRRWAVDFNGDGQTNLWQVEDAIGSVANYFKQHGWLTHKPIIFATKTQSQQANALVKLGLKPQYTLSQLRQQGLKFQGQLANNTLGSVIELKTVLGTAHWLALNNFYVITRYNHSRRYAMAVYQLAESIRHANIIDNLR